MGLALKPELLSQAAPSLDSLPSSDPELPPASFEAFFRAHFGRVYGLLYRVTGNAQDAEDLSQEVFLKVSHRRPLWSSPAASGWLWKAATHTALNELRGTRRRMAREDRAIRQELPLRHIEERDENPAGSLERKERQAVVRRALRQLNERDSALLLARHSGLTYAELAEALNLKLTSVGTLLARAERRFKDLYQSQENQA